MNSDAFSFAQPWWLLALLVIPVVAWMQGGRGPSPAIRFSFVAPLRGFARERRAGAGGFRSFIICAALACLVVALARPRLGKTHDTIESSGVDIILELDVSGSMQAEDFTLGKDRASRLEVVKDVTKRFIEGRPNDRIGIIAFAGRPYLVSPLTLDHDWLLKNLERLRIGLVEDGTSIVAEPNLIAEEYHSALKDFLKNVRDKAHDASADYQLVTTDTPLEPLLREFLTARLPKAKH